jgi:AcrR family transcriptional regulator
MPKIVDHVKRREDILDQCFTLFAKYGYSALTMRQIAQHLNVSTGTLYHYFESKQVLFEAMFRWIAQNDSQKAKQEIRADSEDLAEKIISLQQFIINHHKSLSSLLVIATDYIRTSDVDPYAFIKEIFLEYLTLLQGQVGIQDVHQAQSVLNYIIGNLLYKTLEPSFDLQKGMSFLNLIHLLPRFIDSLPSIMEKMPSATNEKNTKNSKS